MSNLTLQLDDDALRAATVQAISGILTPETKAMLVEKGIEAILKPSTDSWNKNKSVLELAFQAAVEHVARAEAARLVKEDETLRVRIEALLRDTADKVLEADRDKLAERMADAFVSSMRKDY